MNSIHVWNVLKLLRKKNKCLNAQVDDRNIGPDGPELIWHCDISVEIPHKVNLTWIKKETKKKTDTYE